jgi:hypothetical protein
LGVRDEPAHAQARAYQIEMVVKLDRRIDRCQKRKQIDDELSGMENLDVEKRLPSAPNLLISFSLLFSTHSYCSCFSFATGSKLVMLQLSWPQMLAIDASPKEGISVKCVSRDSGVSICFNNWFSPAATNILRQTSSV